MTTGRRPRFQALTERASVSELELFFDLVFVFAITRVTDLMAEGTWLTVAHAGLVLGVLWWTWVGFAWLGNVVRADRGFAKLTIFIAMGASFVLALSIPEAFDDLPGGISGPMVFAVAYAVARVVHATAFWVLSDGDPALRGQIRRWVPFVTIGTALLLIAADTHGRTQTLLWLAALLIDYAGARLAGNDWRIKSGSHFAERHGLIILIALGESIVEIGTGTAKDAISWPIIAASLLGLAVCALLWWAYFDITAPVVARALREADGARQIRIARTCYTFLHLPMVAGIIALSLGLEKVLADAATGHRASPLTGIPLYLLFGGVALFLVSLLVFKFYAVKQVTVTRVVATVAVVLAGLAALPALASLALLTAILAAMVGYESVRVPDLRASLQEGD